MRISALTFLLSCFINRFHSSLCISEDHAGGHLDSQSNIASVSKFITDFHGKSLSTATRSDSSTGGMSESSGGHRNKASEITNNYNHGTAATVKNSTFHLKCREHRKHGSLSVELVNSTRLVSLLMPDPNVTSRLMEAECLVLLFYSRTCPFSCMAAPHFNALPRAFPTVKMAAINAMQYPSFNTQFGIAGVPTVMLFHNGRPASKFNDSDYTLEMFACFITKYTGVKPVEKMFVTSGDFGGPVPSVLAKEPDYLLGMAWAVILIAAAVGISRSTGWRNLVETIQNTWREAQAQHEHIY